MDCSTARRRLPPVTDLPEVHLRDLTERLQRKFGAAVHIIPCAVRKDGRRVKGGITMDYFDRDELDRLLILLGVSDDL